MTTAYRSDLARTVYETEIAELTANPSMSMEPAAVSCPKKACTVQYGLLGNSDATLGEIVKFKAAVRTAMQQQHCPHHPPKIELD